MVVPPQNFGSRTAYVSAWAIKGQATRSVRVYLIQSRSKCDCLRGGWMKVTVNVTVTVTVTAGAEHSGSRGQGTWVQVPLSAHWGQFGQSVCKFYCTEYSVRSIADCPSSPTRTTSAARRTGSRRTQAAPESSCEGCAERLPPRRRVALNARAATEPCNPFHPHLPSASGQWQISSDEHQLGERSSLARPQSSSRSTHEVHSLGALFNGGLSGCVSVVYFRIRVHVLVQYVRDVHSSCALQIRQVLITCLLSCTRITLHQRR